MGDEILARRAASGSNAAFTALYERYHGPLLGYCRSILLDVEDASDAAQTAFENALRALPSRDSSRPLRPWLYRIAHNEAVTILRRRRPTDELGPDTPEPFMRAPEVYAEQRGRLEQLVEDLRSLPERQRGALVMRELNGLSYEEIGGALGLTETNARRAVFDARSALHDVADGRDTDCVAIRRTLSDGDNRSIRARRIRAHLRSCDQCRSFQSGIRARRVELPALAPWLGGAAAASMLGIGSGAAGGGGALIAGGTLGWTALPSAIKSIAVVAVVATTGTAATIEIQSATEPDRPASRSQSAPATQAADPNGQRAKLGAAIARASARRGGGATGLASRADKRASASVALVRQQGRSKLRTPRPVSVANRTPPPASRPSVRPPPPPPPSARRPPSATRPQLSSAEQRLAQIQAQIQAAIDEARAAAAAGTSGGLQDAGALVASTISSVQTTIANVLASVGLSVPSSLSTTSVPSSPTSVSSVTAPAQQLLGSVNTLLGQLLGR